MTSSFVGEGRLGGSVVVVLVFVFVSFCFVLLGFCVCVCCFSPSTAKRAAYKVPRDCGVLV